jgi:hypothetical protein
MPSNKIKMTVTMDVTVPQALALQAMFDYWNQLSSIGGSRKVGYYVDGDGNFHPHVKCEFSSNVPELTSDLRKIAVVEEYDGNRTYDFDPIAWRIEHE